MQGKVYSLHDSETKQWRSSLDFYQDFTILCCWYVFICCKSWDPFFMSHVGHYAIPLSSLSQLPPSPPSHHHHSRNNKQTNKPMIVWSWCGGMLATTKAFVVFGSTLSMNLIPTVDITKYKRCGCVALSGWRAVSPSLPLQFRVSLILNSLTKLPTTSAELTSHVEPQMIGIKTALLSLANTDKNKAGARSQKGWATQIFHSCPWPCLTP